MRPRNLRAKPRRNSSLPLRNQTGQALLIFLGLLALIMVAGSVGVAGSTQQSATLRDAKTQAALAAAKQALIAYATGGALISSCMDNPSHPCVRLGQLPCPDLTNTGICAEPLLHGAGQRLGRLPWKTLGLPDLRDGSGERLWYAVSSGFIPNVLHLHRNSWLLE